MESIEAQLAAGARAFALKHYATATECFSRACESLTAHHPENHPAIIDAHLFYGKALLRNAISLGSLIGPLDGQKSHHDHPSHDQAGRHGQATTPQATSSTRAGASSSSKGSSSLPASKALNKTPQIHFSGDSSDGEHAEEEEEATDEDEAVEGPVTVEEELESAFHALEFARQAIQSQIDTHLINQKPRDETERLQNKLIDVYDLIAQVHQEGEQFEMAVEAYKHSLEIKKSRPDVKAGTVAETHLMIALALELIPDNGELLKQAIEHVDRAIELMRGHLSHLNDRFGALRSEHSTSKSTEPSQAAEGGTNGPSDRAGEVGSSQLRSEIEETRSLIDELEAKKEELKTVPQAPPLTDADQALQAYLNALNHQPHPNGKAIVNDLSKLVKKRPRPPPPPLETSEPSSSNSGRPLEAEQPESSPKRPKI